MPTTIKTPSNATAKMRWKEPYVSEGLNKKLNGIVAAGVVRGGVLTDNAAPMTVTIVDDPNTGDSIYSYIDASGHQVTFRQVGNDNLSLTSVASTTVYVALYVDYTVSSNTVVEWRTYSEAELFGGSPVAEASEVIIVGKVVVPASGVIAASSVTPTGRREAWENVSKSVQPWNQVVRNGHFDQAKPSVLSPGAGHVIGWSAPSAANPHLPEIVTTAPRSGLHELRVQGASSAGTLNLYSDVQPSVRASQLVRVSFWLRGALWTGVGASGVQGMRIDWYDGDRQLLSSTFITDNSLTGTFSYAQIDQIVAAPAGATHFDFGIHLDPDAATPTGDLFFDEVRVWTQANAALEDDQMQRVGFDAPSMSSGSIVPVTSTGIGASIDESVRLLHGGISGSVVSLLMSRMGAGGGLDLDGTNMGIKLQRLIKDLGGSLLGTTADAALPRIESKYAPIVTSKYTLMWEMAISSGSSSVIRVYATENGLNVGTSLVITVNAKWNSGTFVWTRDQINDSIRIDMVPDKVIVLGRFSGDADGWTDIGASWNMRLGCYVVNFGGAGKLEMQLDGRIRHSNAASDPFHAPSSTKALAGALAFDVCATGVLWKHGVAKCWGKVTSDGAGDFALSDGMNIDAISITGGGNLSVSFSANLDNANYVVLCTGRNNQKIMGISLTELTTGFDLDIVQIGAGTDVNLTSSVADFAFAVFGRDF